MQELRLAEEFLDEATSIRHVGAFRSSFARLYYALFHAARAALLVEDVEPRTHKGVLNQFGKLFRDDPLFTDREFELLPKAQTFREIADYEVAASQALTEERLDDLLDATKDFLGAVRKLIEREMGSGH